jgi:pentatricopeptide repeat protein
MDLDTPGQNKPMPSLLLNHVGTHTYIMMSLANPLVNVAWYLHHHVHNHFHHHQPIAMGFLVHSAAAGVMDQPTENPISVPGHFNGEAPLPKYPIGDYHSTSLLERCTNIKTLQQVHAHMVISGLDQDMFSTTKLVNMYAKLRFLVDARFVFESMPKRNVFSWNGMIAGYARDGDCEEALQIYRQMRLTGVQPDKFTFPFLLKACAGLSSLQEGKMIHQHIIRIGCESDVFVGAAVVNMYAKCFVLEDARKMFDKMSQRDVVSWNAMVSGYAQNGNVNEALALFDQMLLADMKPDQVTIACVLSACAKLEDLQLGKWIHDSIIGSVLQPDIFVDNALIDMYAKCGSIEIARELFDKMSRRDVVSWNAMMAGYAHNGCASEALRLFHEMQLAGLRPDAVTLVGLLMACAHLGVLQHGKQIHDYITRNGSECDVIVGNSLIDMYAKCGALIYAERFFDKMSRKDVVSWNAMLAGYVQNGYAGKALKLFHQMQLAHVTPDSTTMVNVVSACAYLGALQQGKWIHDYVIRRGFDSDVFLESALIDMYAKCGSIKTADRIFAKVSHRNTASWNAMIAGYGMHGLGKDAIVFFSQMQEAGVKPDHITFTSVLSACSHAGLVEEGWKYFHCMIQDYSITPMVKHYACMVDLLGRAGQLDEAYDFIINMPLEPDASVWGALLGGCRIHCNIGLGERVAARLFDLEPENTGYFVLMSNMYAEAGKWDGVARIRTLIKGKGLNKTPGWSLIEINNRVHEFVVGKNSHPQIEKIYAMLENLAGQMKEAGYVPDKSFALRNVEEEEKENILCSHSEKLAIAFGLINTSPGTPIQIIKNLRVCGDCHNATKFISNIVRRNIIVRDTNRFHHFKDGLCSCGDYW